MTTKKIIPQAIDLEEAVIGALLIDEKAIFEIDFLRPEMFYNPNNKLIFEGILNLIKENKPVDLLTVANYLTETNNIKTIGGDIFLIDLIQKVSSSAHIEYHAKIIEQCYVKRYLINSSNKTIEKCFDNETKIFELIDYSYSQLNNISENSIKSQEINFNVVINDVIERGVKIANGEIKPGIETPFSKLTKRTGGWRNSELIILAARPGMGKTALALSLSLTAAKNNIPTAFFSLEMSREQLTSRILSMECKINNNKFNIDGLLAEDLIKIGEWKKQNENIPFFIDDTAGLSIEQFQIKAKRLQSKYNIQFLIVDYLQLMSGNEKIREQEISKISRGLKLVAKELNIPIIALSQLSRAVETRGGSKRPMLSDLRESGAIEQDADMVMFLYRPEYYGILEWVDQDTDYFGSTTQNQAEYMVAKNRNGGLIRNRIGFIGKYTLFHDLENQY